MPEWCAIVTLRRLGGTLGIAMGTTTVNGLTLTHRGVLWLGRLYEANTAFSDRRKKDAERFNNALHKVLHQPHSVIETAKVGIQ